MMNVSVTVRRLLERRRLKEQPQTPLESIEAALRQIVSAISQTSNRRSRVIVNTIVGKLSASAAVGGVTGLVATLGTASTGTAIASLSGAAATTAKLYWIGSLVGLGVTGGSVILAGAAIGIGILAGSLGIRKLYGRPRPDEDLQEHEKAILVACITLLKAIAEQKEASQTASASELRQVAAHVLVPLIEQIDQHWDAEAIAKTGKAQCLPFDEKLAYLQLRKLDRSKKKLVHIVRGIQESRWTE